MKVIGLTGSIGMGKSSLVRILYRYHHIPVFEADKIVHHLLSHDTDVIESVRAAFPSLNRSHCVNDNMSIERKHLANLVFSNKKALYTLETLLYPYVKRACHDFLAQMHRRRARYVVIEAPLLIESGIFVDCDQLWVVSASHFLQRHRVMMRSDMSEATFSAVLTRQWSDNCKRKIATHIIPTGCGRAITFQSLAKALLSVAKVSSRKQYIHLAVKREIQKNRWLNHHILSL